MTLHHLFTDIDHALQATTLTDLPAFIGGLAQFQAKAQLRLLALHQSAKGETDELLTIPEVAKRLKVSDYRAYELARQGVLSCVRLGKSVRVKPSAVAEYLAKHGG